MGCFSCSAGKGMCLHSQLPRTGSSGHWLKQKKLWVSISGSSPFPAGLGSCCPLPGPLDPPHPIQALGVQARNVSVSPWRSHWAHQCSPWGCALPFLHSPYSKPCTEFPCHRCLPWSPPWQEPGARGTLQHPGSPPRGKAALGHVPILLSRAQMGTQERSGRSTDGSWGHGAASPGHSEEKGGLQGHFMLPRADVVEWLGSGRQPGGLE